MKLCFSLQSKPSTKPNPKLQKFSSEEDEEQNHPQQHSTTASATEFVTEFDASNTLTAKPVKVIIPPIQNEWRPTKRMKNLQNLPALQADGSRELEFETESISTTDYGDDKMSYGLNVWKSEITTNKADQNGNDENGGMRSSDNVETVILQKLRRDLDRLPEHRGMEEFQDMPVEGFGAALLAGYGWYEGRGIGRNAKEDVKVEEIKKRTAKEGLGYDSSALYNVINANNQSSHSHGSSHRENERDKVKEKYSDGYFVGANVRVIAGRDMGFKGTVVERLGADRVILKLLKTEQEVKVRIDDIAHLGSKEEDRCLRKLKELKIQEEKESKQSNYRDSEKRAGKRSRDIDEVKVEKEHPKADKSGVSWLRSHIRVRIISKDLKGGRFYLKKGEVLDVVGPTTCDISMDGTRELIQGVDQNLLETALPKRGGPVLVLYGKHRGTYGSLVERDLDRETGVVQDADSHDLLNVRLEQVAEYIRDPSYLGY